jgi:hypothetical protein
MQKGELPAGKLPAAAGAALMAASAPIAIKADKTLCRETYIEPCIASSISGYQRSGATRQVGWI